MATDRSTEKTADTFCEQNYFERLGLSVPVTFADITSPDFLINAKVNYKKLLLIYHPDKCEHPAKLPDAIKITKALNDAYEFFTKMGSDDLVEPLANKVWRYAGSLGEMEAMKRKEAAKREEAARREAEAAESEAEKKEKIWEKTQLQAANSGNLEAQIALGGYYKTKGGMGKTIFYYRLAANQGDSNSQFILAEYYAQEAREAQNFLDNPTFAFGPIKGWRERTEKTLLDEKAQMLKYYNLAAAQGHTKAQVRLGDCYREGFGVKKDGKEAFRYYSLAAAQDTEAQFMLSNCYGDGVGGVKDEIEALRYCYMAANNGNAKAQVMLGNCYRDGRWVEENKKEAASYYQLAANQENAQAEAEIGICYENGIGVDKDVKKAITYFKKAAYQNNALGQFKLGELYESGIHVEQNGERAINEYRKAAEQGHTDAQLALANRLMNKYLVGKKLKNYQTEDLYEALKWYRQAANKGNVIAAMHFAGLCHPNIFQDENFIEGKDQRLKLAATYFQKAMQSKLPVQFILGLCDERGSDEKNKSNQINITLTEMFTKLGDCYMSGIGVTKNPTRAVFCYEQAIVIDPKNSMALTKLGMCLEHGTGVKQSEREAVYRYRDAKSLLAKQRLHQLYKDESEEGTKNSVWSDYLKILDSRKTLPPFSLESAPTSSNSSGTSPSEAKTASKMDKLLKTMMFSPPKEKTPSATPGEEKVSYKFPSVPNDMLVFNRERTEQILQSDLSCTFLSPDEDDENLLCIIVKRGKDVEKYDLAYMESGKWESLKQEPGKSKPDWWKPIDFACDPTDFSIKNKLCDFLEGFFVIKKNLPQPARPTSQLENFDLSDKQRLYI